MTSQSLNAVRLWGIPEGSPEFSHENHGEIFHRFFLSVPRLSGQADRLPVVLSAALAEQVCPGSPLGLTGQLRSFNNKSGQGSRLVLSVFAQELTPGEGEFCNCIRLSGTLCKQPILRRTPLGRNICDLMLAVGRRYGRADYLPVIAWGQLALSISALGVGDQLCLEGRVQSRPYTKVTESGSEERVAYEVSMMQLLPWEEES